MMRSDKTYPKQGSGPQDLRVAIDEHSHFAMTKEPVVKGDAIPAFIEGRATEDKQHTSADPCSYLGCNSHTCAWASGGVITRLVARRACANALTIGAGAVGGNATAGTTIITLRDCVNAVRTQTSSCSGYFQLHKDSLACSCVPAGSDCTEHEDENVCRYQVKED